MKGVILELLQIAGQDLCPVLIFIWAHILVVDSSVQNDLYHRQGYKYFAEVLAVQERSNDRLLPNFSEHKVMCSFILSMIACGFPHGQNACWRERVFNNCFKQLDNEDFLLRQWSSLCIGQIWDNNDEIKVYRVDCGTQDKLIALLSDDSPEVRSAVLFALGTFMGADGGGAGANKCGG
jgi:regulator-associated protein of mTOR